MKHLAIIALVLGTWGPVVAAQARSGETAAAATLPDVETAETDLRAVIADLQSGQADFPRYSDSLANLMGSDIARWRPILRSFGPPGQMRLDAQDQWGYHFIVAHPLGDVEWRLMYERGGDRIANLAWELVHDPATKDALARWHGLAYLPGHIWKSWRLGSNASDTLYVDTCWWAELAVRIECDRVSPNGATKRLVYVLKDKSVVLTGAVGQPMHIDFWYEDGSSITDRPDSGGVNAIERTHYTPSIIATDVFSDSFNGRIVAINDNAGSAHEVLADLNAEYAEVVAAKAREEHARIARKVEELGTFGPDPSLAEYEREDAERSSGQAMAILDAFVGGLAEGVADNAALAATLDRATDPYENAAYYEGGYDDGYDDGYEDGGGNAPSPGDAAATDVGGAGTMATVLMAKGFQVPITPGATSNEMCFARATVGPVTTDAWRREGEARQAAASAEQAFLDACRRLGALTAGSGADEFYVDDRAESSYAALRGNRWMHEVSVD